MLSDSDKEGYAFCGHPLETIIILTKICKRFYSPLCCGLNWFEYLLRGFCQDKEL
jgi:hypothetical protein